MQIEVFLSRLGHRDGARPQIILISVGSPKGLVGEPKARAPQNLGS